MSIIESFKKVLTNTQWIDAAQLEAVLEPLAMLTSQLQTDKPCSNSHCFLNTFEVCVGYVIAEEWLVADVDEDSNLFVRTMVWKCQDAKQVSVSQ